MKVDCGLSVGLHDAVEEGIRLEKSGFDGILSAETAHDPFFPLLLAARETERIELMTAIAVAFARSPMLLAHIGHDLNAHSKGRFILGLGSQIQAHITKRFSMPWSHPAARMREYIQALRAIWATWHEGQPLDFHGEFYTHRLMTPFFTPTDTEYGAPRVFLAAVGPLMTEVAGEVADGIICHSFTTENYMRKVTLPAIDRGLAKSGRSRDDFEVTYPGFMVTGETEQHFEKNKDLIKRQIAFYGSTPAYRGVLESLDMGDLQPRLNRMSKQGRWKEMGEFIDDEMLAEFAVVGETHDVISQFRQRYGDVVDRTSIAYLSVAPDTLHTMVTALQAA